MAYMMRRLLWTLPIMLGVLTLVFFLIHMIPGDPVELMLGEYALPADRELMREQLGLNRPIPLQYAEYLKNTLSGDLGQSLPNRRPVTAMILERLPATLELMLGAMAVAVGLALPLGILAAVYHGRWPDQAASVFAVLG
ncbi:MAG: ABC transporter permease, partial [SAR324 cluster bacterium]|nr:ABC transporter permease [SAR324 cluster bacterium]